jgi:hypothetical protein
MAQRHTHPHMSKKLFKIARSGRVIGDFTAKQICEGILSGHFLGTDHYWDADKNAWLLLKEKYWSEKDVSEAEPEKVKFEEKFWHNPTPGSAPDRWFLGLNDPKHWLIVAPILAVGKVLVKGMLSKSGDTKVLGYTILAGVLATLAYFFIREGEDALSTEGELALKNKRQPPYLWTGYIVMLMAVAAVGFTASNRGQQAWRDFNPLRDDFRYEVWSDFDREIFPCFEISFSKLNETAMEKLIEKEKGEAHEFNQEKSGGTIGLRLFDVRKGDRFEIKVQSDGRIPLISESTYAFTADQDYAHSIAYPRLTFDYAQLRAASQTKPINLKFAASRNGGSPITVTQTWHLRQINDCPIGIRARTLQSDGTIKNETLNVAIMTFPGYVNENHPSIPRILDEALSEGRLEAFSGYQEGTQLSVLLQLTAIWKALEKKGIRYSSIGTTTGSSTAVQHVRLIEDTLSTRQANCVDGSTLFASIATKIGLDAYLVLTPGHCYVAIDMPDTKPIGIEMTMLGSSSFLEAMVMATNKGEYSLRRNEKKFEDADPDSGYLVVPIAACRELGIQPIPASK